MSAETVELETIRYERDADGIVTLTMDDPAHGANTMRERFVQDLRAVVDRLVIERDGSPGLAGVILTSAKRTFFAGGDLNRYRRAGPEDAPAMFEEVEGFKHDLRRFETLGVPVVAAINGTALGGGLELALACHHRIAADVGTAVVGLPEVTLGLLPGAGGITRTVRMLGLEVALDQVLLDGRQHPVRQAAAIGLIDDVVDDPDALLAAARSWVSSAPDARQPWDRDEAGVPGGTPDDPAFQAVAPAITARFRARTGGVDVHAPTAILRTAYEGLQVPVEVALRQESRAFVSLVCHSRQSTAMIQATFFDRQVVRRVPDRPEGYDVRAPVRVGVIGAGMMGSGIAERCARAGIEVTVVDVTAAAAAHAQEHARRVAERDVARGRLDDVAAEQAVARITPAAQIADLQGCELVVEAIDEDVAAKRDVLAAAERVLDADAVLGTNTSSIPVARLATALERPHQLLGLHFFSPVHRMPLVEVVRGAATGEAALARGLDLVAALGNTPIVVGDGPGFLTTRVITARLFDAAAMVAEGVDPLRVERAAIQAGYPVGPLQLIDELKLPLLVRIADIQREEGIAAIHAIDPGVRLLRELAEQHGRTGRRAGAGFHDYDDAGGRTQVWPALRQRRAREQPSVAALGARLLTAEALEAVRCLEAGVVTRVEAANIATLLGIGYPAWTGGVVGYVDIAGPGPARLLARAERLAASYGPRFTPPPLLRRVVEEGGSLRSLVDRQPVVPSA